MKGSILVLVYIVKHAYHDENLLTESNADKIADKERERILEKQRKETLKYDKVEIKGDEVRADEVQAEFDAETVIDDRRTTSQSSSTTPSYVSPSALLVEHHDTQPRVAHALAHDLGHGEPVSIHVQLFY